MVKMETRNPVEGSFCSEFPAVCNHCVVMAAWSRKTLKILPKILHFLEKRPLVVKLPKFCSKDFTASLIDVSCSDFVKFGWREISEIVHYLLDKKNFTCLSNCR